MASRTIYPVSIDSTQPAFIFSTQDDLQYLTELIYALNDQAVYIKECIAGIHPNLELYDISDVTTVLQYQAYLTSHTWDESESDPWYVAFRDSTKNLLPSGFTITSKNFDWYKKEGKDTKCRLYFELSKFNSDYLEVIKGKTTEGVPLLTAHVSVSEVSSNKSVVNVVDITNMGQKQDQEVLSTGFTATGIILNVPIFYDAERDKCYVDISSFDLKKGHFAIDRAYKFQVRLSSTNFNPNVHIGEANYIVVFGDTFSEWSTITVSTCIGEPSFNIEKDIDESKSIIYTLNTTFSCKNSNELLDCFKLTISDASAIIETDYIYTDKYTTPNEINYQVERELKPKKQYSAKIEYQTINHYEGEYFYRIDTPEENSLEGYAITEVVNNIGSDSDEGRISLNFVAKDGNPYDIYRAEAVWKPGAARIWQKIGTLSGSGCYYDYTIESGIFYDYAVMVDDKIQIFDNNERHFRREFEYNYILGVDGQQLKVPYDMQISSYKINVSDQLATTIGSPYPFISRSNKIYYKTIPITGTITLHMDDNHTFVDCNEFIPSFITDNAESYASGAFYDYTTEREFRDLVMTFLLDGKAKLFKSATEGNVMVRLMDVSFSPKQQLNRMIYSFSATAQEIAEFNADKLEKYNICSLIPSKDNNNIQYHLHTYPDTHNKR